MGELPGYHDQTWPDLLVATAAEWDALLAERDRLRTAIYCASRTTPGHAKNILKEALETSATETEN